jgi:threonine dehydratase
MLLFFAKEVVIMGTLSARRFIGKVLPDGHLSLPEDAAREVGSVFEVILMPVQEQDIYAYAESLAKEKGFPNLTPEDVESIIHGSRGLH